MKIVTKFEKKNPGLIAATLTAGRRDYFSGVHRTKSTYTHKATVAREGNMTYIFELPAGLYQAVEAVFPSMFRSKKHFEWFKTKFSKIMIGYDL